MVNKAAKARQKRRAEIAAQPGTTAKSFKKQVKAEGVGTTHTGGAKRTSQTKTTKLPPKTQPAVTKKVIKAEPIEAKRKDDFGVKEFLLGKSPEGVKVSAPSVGLGLPGGISAVKNIGLGATDIVGGSGQIARTKTAITGAFKGATTTSVRQIIGKPGNTRVDKIFMGARGYTTNSKSIGLSNSLLVKAGLTLSAAGIATGAIGSYPFAGFIKEEALQTLSIPILVAMQQGDFETAQSQVEAVDELLNQQSTILDNIPYLNVQRQLKNFFAAAEKSNNAWKDIIASGQTQPSFSEERASADAEARLRELEERGIDAEYFELIREGSYEEAEELRLSELKGGT